MRTGKSMEADWSITSICGLTYGMKRWELEDCSHI